LYQNAIGQFWDEDAYQATMAQQRADLDVLRDLRDRLRGGE
jgi:hypothetical protein